MPWTKDDVERFNKDLPDAKKEQWVEAANSALAACLKDGGKQDVCEASAIKQANGVVTNVASAPPAEETAEMECYRAFTPAKYTPRTETHQGRKHMVVPVVMMVEGVHAGSHGPLLHLGDELGRCPEAWNGMPITPGHPERDGVAVSCNAPDIVDQRVVGRVYNTNWTEDRKLKAEAWLDEVRLQDITPDTLERLKKGEALEVSVGVFSDEEKRAGEWNGEAYQAVARNHKPDHLALLPNEIGACSIKDGCGVRANHAEQQGGETIMTKIDDLISNDQTRFVECDRSWLKTLEEAHLDKLYPQSAEDETVKDDTQKQDEEEEEQQAEGKEEEAQAAPAPAVQSRQSKEEEQQMTEEKAIQVLRSQLSDPERFLNLLPDETREQMKHGLKLHRQHRTELTNRITANTDVFCSEELARKTTDDLEKLAQAIKPKADYSANAGGVRPATNEPGEILLPPGVGTEQ